MASKQKPSSSGAVLAQKDAVKTAAAMSPQAENEGQSGPATQLDVGLSKPIDTAAPGKKPSKAKAAKQPAPKKAAKLGVPAKKDWEIFGQEKYARLSAELSHLSGKLVNTKAGACGVRLGPDSHQEGPYIAVSCLPPGAVALDYISDSRMASVRQQMIAAAEGTQHAKYNAVDAQDAEFAASEWNKALGTDAILGGAVSTRLRQILLPMQAKGLFDKPWATSVSVDDYVALSPLHAGGISQMLSDRLEKNQEEFAAAILAARLIIEKKDPKNVSDKDQYIAKLRAKKYTSIGEDVFMPFGGAKPMNATAFGKAVQKVTLFSAPIADEETRVALGIYHRGAAEIAPKFDLVAEYATFLRKIKKTEKAGDKIGLGERTEEKQTLSKIMRDLLNKGDAARAKLTALRERGLVSKILEPQLPAVQKGLIDPTLRSPEWARDLAITLTQSLADKLRNQRNEEFSIVLSEADRFKIEAIFKEEALK